MTHQDSWFWTRRTFMKSSLAAALLAGYKVLWSSAAEAGSHPTTHPSGQNVIRNIETDPFGVAGFGERGMKKSRLGFELCPGRRESGGEG